LKKRQVLSFDLKQLQSEIARRPAGREFHDAGPACENERTVQWHSLSKNHLDVSHILTHSHPCSVYYYMLSQFWHCLLDTGDCIHYDMICSLKRQKPACI